MDGERIHKAFEVFKEDVCEYLIETTELASILLARRIRSMELIVDPRSGPKLPDMCTCHERDGSFSCPWCKSRGIYGHCEERADRAAETMGPS